MKTFISSLKSTSQDLIAYIKLTHRLTVAINESEREDVAVEIVSLRSASVAVSVLAAVIAIHARHPLLFPLVFAGLALKLAFF